MQLHEELIDLLHENKELINSLGEYCDILFTIREKNIEIHPTSRIRKPRKQRSMGFN